MTNRFCWRCLRGKHHFWDCKSNFFCSTCKGKHASVLHGITMIVPHNNDANANQKKQSNQALKRRVNCAQQSNTVQVVVKYGLRCIQRLHRLFQTHCQNHQVLIRVPKFQSQISLILDETYNALGVRGDVDLGIELALRMGCVLVKSCRSHSIVWLKMILHDYFSCVKCCF